MSGNFDGRIADLVYWSDGFFITAQNFSDIYDLGTTVNEISVINPQNTSYGSSSFLFEISTISSADWCGYSLDGAGNTTMNTNNSTYFYYNQTGLTETSHSVIFHCNDSEGEHYNSSLIDFIVDFTPFAATLESPVSQSYAVSNIDINVSLSKAGDSCLYSLDGEENVSMNEFNSTFYSNTVALSNGEHEVFVHCLTALGNLSSDNVTFLISAPVYDAVGEWGAVTNLQEGGWTTVTFNHTFDDVPVVIHQVNYNYDYDNNPCSTRIREVSTTGFQIRAESWSPTSSCPATGVDGYWIAMEKGVYSISNEGSPLRAVEVTNFTMSSGACGSGANPADYTLEANHREFQSSWSYQPLVLGSVQTANDLDVITHYIRGCSNNDGDTWNTTCVEIGLNGLENDGTIQPCNLHTSDEEGGYIAWQMDSDWSDADTLDNSGTTGDGLNSYSWQAYWEEDSVQGSQNDAHPTGSYYITLPQTYSEGAVFASSLRIDGPNGLFPVVNFTAPANTVYFLAEEDEYGDTEQSHNDEPFELLFFESSSGYLFSEDIVPTLEVKSPINGTTYGVSEVGFIVESSMGMEACYYSLNGGSNQSMNKVNSTYFDYASSPGDGDHNVTFYCSDVYGGDYFTGIYSFSIDSTPLILTSLSPLAQTYSTSSFDFIVNTSKNVTWCKYSLDGAANVSMTEVNSTYFTYTGLSLREGSHDVDYFCGGVSSQNSTNVSFDVDISAILDMNRGSTLIPDGSLDVNVSFSAQDLSKAFLLFSVRSSSSSPSQIQVLGELMEDKINFRRYSTIGNTYIEWQVIESPDIYVQRGNVEYGTSSGSESATINSVDLSESFATVSNRLNSGTTSENVRGFWTVEYGGTTGLDFSRGTTGTAGELHYQAIEWDEAFVQSGSLSGSGTTPSDTLGTSVNTSRSFLLFSRAISGATSLQDTHFRGYFVDEDDIEFSKNGGSVTYEIEYFVVEKDQFYVQSGSRSVSGSSAVDETISSVQLNQTFSLESHDSTGGGTTFANAFLVNSLTSETNLRFLKGTPTQTQDVEWFVVEIGEAPVTFLTVVSPLEQTYSDTTIDFNVSLDSAGDWCGYSLDGESNTTMSSVNSTYFSNTETGLSVSEHNVTFYCNDTLGVMYSSSNIVFDIDSSYPTVTSLDPVNETTNYSNTVMFTYNATDNGEISVCSLVIDDEKVWNDTSVTMNISQFFEVYLDDGVYYWSINCSDAGGLEGASEKRMITIDGPDVYSWENRFYETSISDFTSEASISLDADRDGTENGVSMDLLPSQLTTTTIALSPYLGNDGAIIPSSTLVDFSAYATASTNNVGYITWKAYVKNSSGETLICQYGDDFTGGTRISSASGTWTGSCDSPSYDWVLKKSDRIKLVINVYNADTSNLSFSHSWDDLRLSFLQFADFNLLGSLEVNLTNPATNSTVDLGEVFNLTCSANCSIGACSDTNVYVQYYNGSSWEDMTSSGNMSLDAGESNPHSLGSVSSMQYTNFSLKANTISFNDLRCIGISSYSSSYDGDIRNLEVLDANLAPEVILYSPETNYYFNTSNVELFYNVTDVNDNVINSTLILNDVLNISNETEILNGEINNFTLVLNDGVYNWTVNVTDAGGLNATDETVRTFTVDTTKPVFELHNPVPDEILTSINVDFNFTVTDNLDLNLVCNLTIDETVVNESFSAESGNSTLISYSVDLGDHLWNVTCVDEAGNVNTSSTRNFSISDFPPIVTQLTNDSTWVNSSDIVLEYNVTDNGDVSECSVYINDVFNSTNTSAIVEGEVNNFSLSGFADSGYNWSVNCTDNANLSSLTGKRAIYIDTTPPSIDLNLPDDEFVSSASDLNLNFTVTDLLDSELLCNMTVGGSVVDVNFTANSGDLTNRGVYNLTDGEQNWNITCTDEAGNVNTSETRDLTIEEVPNIVLNTANDSWFYENLQFEYTPDDNSDLKNCSLIIDGAFNRTNETEIMKGDLNEFVVNDFGNGIYNWTIECSDLYGLTGYASESRTAYRDNVAPLINLSTPLDGDDVFSGNVEFNFTVTDNLSPNMSCNLTVDSEVVDSNFSVLDGNLTNRVNSISPGVHFWNVTCWDNVGTANTSETRNFTNYEAPGVSLDQPDNNTWMNYSNITFTYNVYDGDNNIVNCSLYINGILNQTNSSAVENGALNNFTLNVEEGLHNWTVECIDDTSLSGTDGERNFYVDTTIPGVILNEPEPDEILTWNNITFNFSVIDNLDDYLNCSLIIDSYPEIEGINVTNGTDEIQYVLRNDGNYSWQVQCKDEAGNVNLTDEQNFSMVAPPTVNLISPSNDSAATNSTITFSYLPQDAVGLLECSLYIDDILNQTDYDITKNEKNSFNPVSGISEGIHNWTVGCVDADSNAVNASRFIFIRDVSPPNIILNSPDNESGIDINDGEVYFNWTAIDTYDDVLQCNLTVGGQVVEEDQWVSSNISHSEKITGLNEGYYEWNVTCWDQLKNANTSISRFFNLTYPDFTIENFSFNATNPYEGEIILINATVKNLGGADTNNVIVGFYQGNPSSGGINIENETIDLDKNETVYLTSEFAGEIGVNEIFVTIDYGDIFNESDETNNQLNQNISIGSWQFFYGDILSSSEYELAGNQTDRLISWNATNFNYGNLFVADSESSISWGDLISIGKKTNGDNSSNDFSEIDSLLNMADLSDSVYEVYTTAGEINGFGSFIVFGKTLTLVPVADSINNSNFITGVLWDSFDDADGEFDVADKEDLVYVAKVNPDSLGAYGTYDYELRVPARLREYDDSNSDSVVFYAEVW
ncbi:MAG: CARDB domain-containing protein [Candidatus Pacearchaeota archaeon]